MVLFTIACETCASRLNVKQQAAIGQVLACPKCGSMVHVEPPEGWEPPASQTAPPAKPRPPRNPNDSQATLSGEFGNLENKTQTRRAVTPKSKAGEAKPVAQAPPVQEAIDVVPASQWESDGSGQRGNTMAWIAGIVGICLIALVLILYMVTRMIGSNENPADQVAQGDSPDKTNVVDEVADDSNETGADENQKKDAETDAKKGGADEDSDSNTSDVNPPDNADASTTDVDETNNTEPDDPSAETETEGSGLDVDAALKPGDSVTMDQDEDTRSMLDDFAGIGDLVFGPGINMDEFREATSEDQTHKLGIGNVYVPVPRPIKVVPVAATNETYLGLAFKDQPLIEFCRNLFRITQVPVQLDGRAIVDGQIDPLAAINATANDVTAIEILEKAIEPLNLTWRWNADETVIVIIPRVSAEIMVSEIPLDPALAITDADAAAKLIKEIQVLIEPGSWNTDGGAGAVTISTTDHKLIVEQTEDVAQRVQALIARLVLAARLKASPDDLLIAEQLSTVYSGTEDIRNSEATVKSVQLEPIHQLLNELHQQDGVTIVVNWTELSKENWNPNVKMPWNSQGSTIGETLRELTNSMGLAYRMLDKETLEITSREKFWNETRLEIYPCNRQLKNNYTGNQLIQFLKEGIIADLPKQEYTRVDFLPQYGCIVALLPDPLHVRVEKILQQLAERE